jgi:hypothetical protein
MLWAFEIEQQLSPGLMVQFLPRSGLGVAIGEAIGLKLVSAIIAHTERMSYSRVEGGC